MKCSLCQSSFAQHELHEIVAIRSEAYYVCLYCLGKLLDYYISIKSTDNEAEKLNEYQMLLDFATVRPK